MNRYAYCRNNPINYIDPTGLSWWSKFWSWLTGGIGAIIAAVAIIVVTAVANIFTGGALTPILMGEIFGAIGGAAGAAAMGGDIGRGMLIGTIVGGVTGGILGPGSGGAGGAAGAEGGGAAAGGTAAGSAITSDVATWSISAASVSATEVASAVAMPAWTSVLASGVVGGGAVVISNTMSEATNRTNVAGAHGDVRLYSLGSSSNVDNVAQSGPKLSPLLGVAAGAAIVDVPLDAIVAGALLVAAGGYAISQARRGPRPEPYPGYNRGKQVRWIRNSQPSSALPSHNPTPDPMKDDDNWWKKTLDSIADFLDEISGG